MDVYINRYESSDQGTFGALDCTGFSCSTAELPWRDNKRSASCIPAGTYTATKYMSSRFGVTFIVNGVPGRSGILFHWGNFAGDRDLGFKSNSDGCILLGVTLGHLSGQRVVLSSSVAFHKFLSHLSSCEEFTLHITEQYDSSNWRAA